MSFTLYVIIGILVMLMGLYEAAKINLKDRYADGGDIAAGIFFSIVAGVIWPATLVIYTLVKVYQGFVIHIKKKSGD